MKNSIYKNFTILEEYPNDEAIEKYTAFVWCKGEHYKAMVYGTDIEDSMWGLGDTAKEAVEQAIDDYWYYENLELQGEHHGLL